MSYTKAQLEEIVYTQLANLNAMHDLVDTIKSQNQLLGVLNRALRREMIKTYQPDYPVPKRKRTKAA